MSDDKVVYQDFIFFAIWPSHVIQNKEKYIMLINYFYVVYFFLALSQISLKWVKYAKYSSSVMYTHSFL